MKNQPKRLMTTAQLNNPSNSNKSPHRRVQAHNSCELRTLVGDLNHCDFELTNVSKSGFPDSIVQRGYKLYHYETQPKVSLRI